VGMDRFLPGFFSELEKIAVSKRVSEFTQTRKGRRPIRVSTLLSKECANRDYASDQSDNEPSEYEHGSGMLEGGGGPQ
jgi:hypothetical protein